MLNRIITLCIFSVAQMVLSNTVKQKIKGNDLPKECVNKCVLKCWLVLMPVELHTK